MDLSSFLVLLCFPHPHMQCTPNPLQVNPICGKTHLWKVWARRGRGAGQVAYAVLLERGYCALKCQKNFLEEGGF